jgi:ascorbate-specific PTS system EIIC-type component UlaA
MGFKSRRREVWDYYRRTWRDRLLTVFLAVSATTGFYANESGASSAKLVLLALVCGLLSILWLPIYPLLMFKRKCEHLK